MRYYSEGFIQPIHPMKIFSASDIQDCFRYMQKGTHLGKIVISMSQSLGEIPTQRKRTLLSFNPDASYLLVGGLGGLGKAVSTWMVEHGARHLVFLSRNAGRSARDQEFFAELESQGCSVHAIAGSVANMTDVKNAVESTMKSVRGVIQMSMVLRVM